MDPRRPAEDGPSAEASDFVRFCYRRRRARWPELYDEMCAVASRGLYRGWGFTELADHGVAFSLFDMPRLATLVAEVAVEENDRRLRGQSPARHAKLHDDADPLGDARSEAPAFLAVAALR